MSGRYDMPDGSWDGEKEDGVVISEIDFIWERFTTKLELEKNHMLTKEQLEILADQAELEVDVFFKMIERRYMKEIDKRFKE